MIDNNDRYWFRRKRFGLGLDVKSGSRKGIIATVLFVLLDAGGAYALIPFFAHTHPAVIVIWAIGWTIAFIAFAYTKCEPRRSETVLTGRVIGKPRGAGRDRT